MTETGTEAKTTATSSAAPDDFVVAAVGLKRAKASEKTKAKASVPVEKKGAAKKTAKPAAVPEKKAPAVGKKTSESADARKAERRARARRRTWARLGMKRWRSSLCHAVDTPKIRRRVRLAEPSVAPAEPVYMLDRRRRANGSKRRSDFYGKYRYIPSVRAATLRPPRLEAG